MRVQRLVSTALIVVLVGVTAYAADVWHLLASTSVSATPPDATASQHDEIRLPSARGSFARLRLAVDGGTVMLDRLVITFAHGSKQAVDLKGKAFESGAFTHEIALAGNDRVIRSVDFWYRASKFANVRLYAR